MRTSLRLTLIVILVLAVTQISQAGLGENVMYGLGYAGLQPQLFDDPYQDGFVVEFERFYDDVTFDFGNVELNLTGPVDGNISFGRRGIDEFAFSLNADNLQYTLTEWDGVNRVEVQSGVLDLQQNFKINRYGFYELEYFLDTSADLVSSGLIDNEALIDISVGPIKIQGHWLLDLINTILFELTGTVLPGGAFESSIVLSDFDAAKAPPEALFKAATCDAQAADSMIIPEPAAIVLLLVGLPVLLRRRVR